MSIQSTNVTYLGKLEVYISLRAHGGGERGAQDSSGETRGKEAIGETQT